MLDLFQSRKRELEDNLQLLRKRRQVQLLQVDIRAGEAELTGVDPNNLANQHSTLAGQREQLTSEVCTSKACAFCSCTYLCTRPLSIA